ncbi:hypothetical protein X777_10248 [Ooceraea biroi]|nr:hypothetical protein X777_10248 [Ooceraea biroi]
MATKTSNSSGPQTKKTFPAKSSGSNTDNLVTCSICKRNFAQDRISYHETICAKTTSKKRKQFNTKIFRIRGTEIEPFAKEGFDKKQESKTKKPEVKSDWRRKHEDFITTIRYAKQVQAHVAAGGNPNDISPPPPSDTSDYIQCPHCGRKFNRAAADRHIPKCENMRHNKPANSRAPRPRR